MRRINTGGAVILLFCMVLLGGCPAGNETAAESAAEMPADTSGTVTLELVEADSESTGNGGF
ncbi:MAG: hypothetical protein J6C19_13000 [Lachnospiraceae bacterium]|nr:hypothetical protein [Lachnospiraceae bacterium]